MCVCLIYGSLKECTHTHNKGRLTAERCTLELFGTYMYKLCMIVCVCECVYCVVVSIIRLWAVEVSWKLKVQCEWRTGYAAVGCRMAAHLLRRWSSLRAQI